MKLFKNKVFKNASWLIASKLIQSVLGLVITIFSARYLGPSNYGLISYASSIVTFVTPFAMLGLANVQVQAIVNNPENEGKIIGSSVIMSIVSSFFCMLGAIAFSLIADANEKVTNIVVALYSLILIPQSAELIMYWYQAKYLTKYYAIVSLCSYLIVSVYKIILLVTKTSVYLFALSNMFDYLLISISLFFIYKKKGNQRIQFDKTVAKELLLKSKYYIVPSLMVAIFSQTDHIMIKHMMGEEYTGYYQVALSCSNCVAFVFAAIVDAFRPSIFEEKNKTVESYEYSLKKLFFVIILLGVFEGLSFLFLSKYIVDFLYGEQYLLAIPALMVLAWQPLFSYLGVSRNVWVLAEGQQKYLWIFNLIGAVSNVILNIILIPICGIMGAAIASVVTQAVTNVLCNIIFRPYRGCAKLMLQSISPIYWSKLLKNRKS